jgi:hypothetical protein
MKPPPKCLLCGAELIDKDDMTEGVKSMYICGATIEMTRCIKEGLFLLIKDCPKETNDPS